MNIDHNNNQETNRLWQESEKLPFIKGLKAGRSMAEVMAKFDSRKAFKDNPDELGCSDGRCQGHRLGIAGNGILLSGKELDDFVHKNKGKITTVMSHEGCGAAAIKFKQLAEAGESLPAGVATSDDLGIYHSRNLAKRLGADYGDTRACDMSGEVHNERAIYFDGKSRINPRALPELPAGFICSGPALGLGKEYMEKEIQTLAQIALGDHGFGERFNRENPLYVVVSAETEQQLEELKRAASKAAEKFDGRLAVDGFLT